MIEDCERDPENERRAWERISADMPLEEYFND